QQLQPQGLITLNDYQWLQSARADQAVSSQYYLDYQLLTGDENQAQRANKIREAGKNNVVTITTSLLGRGTDFSPEHPDGLRVILTYLDRERNIEQIMGRTARNGMLGKFLAFYNHEHIKQRYGINLPARDKAQRKKIIKR